METKRKITLTPPSSWGEMSWDAVVTAFTDRDRPSFEHRLEVFQKVMGWAFVGESYIDLPNNDRDACNMDDFQLKELLEMQLRELEKAVWEQPNIMVVFRDKETGTLGELSLELLYGCLKKYMQFLDSPSGFTTIPKEHIQIGRHKYLLPETLMTNLTYQQYSAVQNALSNLWDLQEYLVNLYENKGQESEINEVLGNIAECKADFMANILTPQRFVFFEESQGKIKWVFRHRYIYNADDVEKEKKVMKLAPDYLFDILLFYYHGCLEVLSKKFTHLFSSKGGKGGSDLLVAELDSINNIMKYQGYKDQQDVYDSNALFILSILNRMTEEAKEIQKIKTKKK